MPDREPPSTSDPTAIRVPPGGLPEEPAERALHERLRADPRIHTVLVPRSHLDTRVRALAQAIARDTLDDRPLTLAIVLKGAATFGTDLGEALCHAGAGRVRYEFLRASTYGTDLKGAGETGRTVRIALAPGDLRGADVVLVDDLVDQAFTLSHLVRYLREEAGAAAVRTCVLAAKALANPDPAVARLRSGLRLDHVGFQVPDRWIAGYGIDAGEDFRNLPCIVTVHEQHYRA